MIEVSPGLGQNGQVIFQKSPCPRESENSSDGYKKVHQVGIHQGVCYHVKRKEDRSRKHSAPQNKKNYTNLAWSVCCSLGEKFIVNSWNKQTSVRYFCIEIYRRLQLTNYPLEFQTFTLLTHCKPQAFKLFDTKALNKLVLVCFLGFMHSNHPLQRKKKKRKETWTSINTYQICLNSSKSQQSTADVWPGCYAFLLSMFQRHLRCSTACSGDEKSRNSGWRQWWRHFFKMHLSLSL